MSKYTAYVVFRFKSWNNYSMRLNRQSDINTILSHSGTLGISYGSLNNESFVKLSQKAMLEGSSYLVVKYNIFTCRETLIKRLLTTLNMSYAQENTLANPTIFVEYNVEGGSSLSKSQLESASKFGEKFFSSPFENFFMRVNGDSIITSFESSPGFIKKYLLELSLFLYLVRNVEIMNSACKKFPQRTNTVSLLLYLCEEFLKKPEWGDGSNPAMRLSMFCYAITQDISFLDTATFPDGPIQAVSLASPLRLMLDYIKGVFMDNYKGKLDWDSNLLGSIHIDFRDNFEELYKMCLATEEYNKILTQRYLRKQRNSVKKAQNEAS